MCLYRGSVPCDLLFIADAPGMVEDIYGQPLVGPSGKILNIIIQDAFSIMAHRPIIVAPPSVGFCNVVACIPDLLGNRSTPTQEEIYACSPRLNRFLSIAAPKWIVTLGDTAHKEVEQVFLGECNMCGYVGSKMKGRNAFQTIFKCRKCGSIHFRNEREVPILPLVHPAFISRSDDKLSLVSECAGKLVDFLLQEKGTW